MKTLKANEGKIYQSLVDSSIYATTVYLGDNDNESNWKLIDESEVIITTLEEDDTKEIFVNNIDLEEFNFIDMFELND